MHMAGFTEERWHVPLTWLLENPQESVLRPSTTKESRLTALRYIDFSMHRVRMLIHFGVIPYIVFDGDYLPSKAATEVERAKKREESKRKGLDFYKLNKPSQAHLELQKAVDVTPAMARELIDELKKIGVQYVVAPYEADAQLVYLERKEIIQGILSEDSDLLVFGAKCLLTKIDQYGECVEINRADFTACRDISLVGWSDAEFRRMAILSGCDYLTNINRMGLKSAYRLVRKYKTIEKILRILQFDGQYCVPPGYLEAFHKAELTFLHQRVFCPVQNDVVMMTEIDGAQPEDMAFIGSEVEQAVAIGVASGDLDPMTKAPIVVSGNSKSTPRMPWTNNRLKTPSTYNNIKENKSIESFFGKPKRTPLAELDPNSFTPSPTQDRLLQQAIGTSWASSPAPSVPPARSAAPVASSAPLSALASLGADTTFKGIVTGQSWPKRRRLCHDLEDPSQITGDSGEVRSRFFSANVPDSTPSGKQRRTNNRGKETAINIWSDDSVENVMADLPDVSDVPAPRKKGNISVFKDDEPKVGTLPPERLCQKREPVQEDSQTSTSSRGSEMSAASISTAATSVSSQAPSIVQKLDESVRAELAALARFSYRPEKERIASEPSNAEKALKPLTLSNTIEQPTKANLFRQKSMTPLQRLGAGALNRSQSCTQLSSRTPPSTIKENNAPALSAKGIDIPTVHIPQLPFHHSIGPDASMKGSEDAIIPDSESEGEAISDAEQAKPVVDLGRFAFSG